jgi:hypothetical protein
MTKRQIERRAAALQQRREQRRELLERRHAILKERQELAQARRIGRGLRDLGFKDVAVHPSRALVPVAPAPLAITQPDPPPGYYKTLAEAQAAMLREHANKSNGSNGVAVGLAIGLAAVAVVGIGVVIYYLLVRKDKDQTALSGPIVQPAPSIIQMPPQIIEREIIREGSGKRKKQKSLPALHVSQVKTLQLPSLTNPRLEALGIINATEAPWRIQIRTIGPPGGFAILSFDAGELSMPMIGTVPEGNTFILGAGGDLEIHLAPRQRLYGKGSMPGVTVSVSGSEARDLMV